MPSTTPGEIAYPVTLDVRVPERYERVQVLLRVLVGIAIGVLHQSLGGLFGALYFFVPVVVAVLVSRKGGAGFISADSRWLCVALEWVIGLYAYLLFVTDRFPLDTRDRHVTLHVQPMGVPTVGQALVRLLTSFPHALVLALLSLISGLISLVALVAILLTQSYPSSLRRFQRNLLARLARLLVYHASLVEAYPPFAERDTTPPARLPPAGGAPTPPATA